MSHARRGDRVFPVHSIVGTGACSCWKGEKCKDKGKHPRITNNLTRATTDEEQIREWWKRWPDANIGSPTGAESGVWVFDVDPRHGGISSLKRLVDEHGNLVVRRVVRTGGGGRHLYFEHPGGFKIRSRDSALGKEEYPGLDVKGDGGYVLLPPSNHESGGMYEMIRDGEPSPAPDWLLEAVREPQTTSHNVVVKRSRGDTLSCPDLDGPPIVEGIRNDTLTRIAGKLHDGTRTLPQLVEDLLAINDARCPAPLSTGEVGRIARSISRYEPCRKSSEPPPPEVIGLLGEILAAWWEEEWKGPGGPSERDVMLALILVGLSHGRMLPSGNILVPIAFSQLAELARLGSKSTAHRAYFRLREKGWTLGGGNGPDRKPDEPAGIALLPRKPERSLTTQAYSTFGVECVPPCAPPTTARGRHSAPCLRRIATKRRIAVIDHLERAGRWLHEDALASLLGIKRTRDVRRRHLEPLKELGVVESSGGGEWRLTEGWILALQEIFAEERALERDLYGGKTADERLRERHQQEREAYRSRDEFASDRVPTHDEMREFRESYPRRRREAIEEAMNCLFAERPEYRSKRVGQITCALIDYLPLWFPRGLDGHPKDAEVEAVLNGEPVAA